MAKLFIARTPITSRFGEVSGRPHLIIGVQLDGQSLEDSRYFDGSPETELALGWLIGYGALSIA